MGFYVRKSVNFGPLRVNLSKSGVGYSVGGRGFRTGVRADGRRYTRASVPGTGIGYHQVHSRAAGSGCLLYVALLSGTLAAGTAALASTVWAAAADADVVRVIGGP